MFKSFFAKRNLKKSMPRAFKKQVLYVDEILVFLTSMSPNNYPFLYMISKFLFIFFFNL